jgi:hypothetical protein
MSPNYIDFPERREELRAEVGRLLEDDETRAGEVFRTSVEAMQARKGTPTPGSNEDDYILPGLLDARIPEAVEGRKMVAARLRSWLKKKKDQLSPELQADFTAQLEAIAAVDAGSPLPHANRGTEGPEEKTPTVKSGWDPFMYWVEKIVGEVEFRRDERDYKVEAARPLKDAVIQLRAGGDWREPLARAILVQKGNLVDWHVTGGTGNFGDWSNVKPDACTAALAALWAADDSHGGERIAAFDALVPAEVVGRPGGLANLGAYLLGGLDEERWPNFRIGVLERAWELAQFPSPADHSAAGNYEHALTFFDAIKDEAAARGFTIKDRLDAQGAMWVIASGGDRGPYTFTVDEWTALEAFTGVEKPARLTVAADQRVELPDDTDRVVLAKARAEQARLRDYLLPRGATTAHCSLCGRLLPRDLLVAAHIIPRSQLDHGERMQFDRIAMLACLLGCDELFELGYLTVDDEGTIRIRDVDSELTPILAELAGRRCAAHDDKTAAAFAAHRTSQLR